MATKERSPSRRLRLKNMQMSERQDLQQLLCVREDELIEVKYTDSDRDVFMVTKYGRVYPF